MIEKYLNESVLEDGGAQLCAIELRIYIRPMSVATRRPSSGCSGR
jgi:hypothetical protein